MKILYVCEGFNNHSIKAQPWKHVFELASRMQQTYGDEVYILTNNNTKLEKINKIGTIPLIKINKGKFLFNIRELEKILKNEYSIIDWHASGALSAINFLRIKKAHSRENLLNQDH